MAKVLQFGPHRRKKRWTVPTLDVEVPSVIESANYSDPELSRITRNALALAAEEEQNELMLIH